MKHYEVRRRRWRPWPRPRNARTQGPLLRALTQPGGERTGPPGSALRSGGRPLRMRKTSQTALVRTRGMSGRGNITRKARKM